MRSNKRISAKLCVILMCVALAMSCGPKVKTDSRFIRSGDEIYPARPDDQEMIVFKNADEAEWYAVQNETGGYRVIGQVFADAEASTDPVEFGCVSISEDTEGYARDKITEALTKEARKFGADAIFGVSINTASGTCGPDKDKEECGWAYGQATAIRFSTSG